MLRWETATWREHEARDPRRTVALLPVGAVEAHGPHLAVEADVVIAEAMAQAAGERLRDAALEAVSLPALSYTAAPFASAFAGTISVRPSSVTALVVDLGRSLHAANVACLAIANSHLDPTHLGSLHEAAETLREEGTVVAFPDITRKPWALRLGEEFRSGACHAGRYETSIVLAARAKAVREDLQKDLPENDRSLSEAIRNGHESFVAAGGPEAYFGAPALATEAEGRKRIAELGAILFEAVQAELGASAS